MAVNRLNNLLLLGGVPADGLECLSGAAVRADEGLVVLPGKRRSAVISPAAVDADFSCAFGRFLTEQKPSPCGGFFVCPGGCDRRGAHQRALSCAQRANACRMCARKRSAIGVNVWYLFQMRYNLVSSAGYSGRKTSPLRGEVSTSRSNVS